MRFLYQWQHMKHGSQLHGPDGALHIIKQLQGYEISAAAWEGDVLRRRDRQVRAGAARSALHFGRSDVGTAVAAPGVRRSGASAARESPRPACKAHALGAGRSVPARRRAVAAGGGGESCRVQRTGGRTRGKACRIAARASVRIALSVAARRSSPIVVNDTHQLTSVVEDALWELAAAGLVTADGFENLRALHRSKEATGHRAASCRAARRFVPGRWALLRADAARTSHRWFENRDARGNRAPACCCDGAWSSAIFSLAKPSRRRGGICW